jgi:hypothetical protein
VLRDQLFQFGYQAGVLTRGQFEVDAFLDGREPPLLQRRGLPP